MRIRARRGLFRRVTVWAPAAWLGLFVLVPALMVVAVSLMARDETGFVAPAFSLEGYRTILSPLFLGVLWRSLVLAGGATLLCLMVGYPFAWCLARRTGRFRGLLLLMVIIPFWTNSLIRTYAMVFILKANGLFSQALMALGLSDGPVSLMYTDVAVFAGLVYTLLPFMILPLYASIEKLDVRLLEAAQDLGAGRVRTFLSVTWPLTMPGVVAGCLMVFLPALGMFYIPDLMGGGKHLIVGNFIKNQFLTARNWPAGSAASVVLTGMMLLLLLFYRRAAALRRGGSGGPADRADAGGMGHMGKLAEVGDATEVAP
ncbi:MAG: spermidine/putrescine ABC transporter permease PotB [Desulfovibrionaceae bacterium]